MAVGIIQSTLTGKTTPIETHEKYCPNCGDVECEKYEGKWFCTECFLEISYPMGGDGGGGGVIKSTAKPCERVENNQVEQIEQGELF